MEVHHLLGIRPSPSDLLLRPILLSGLDDMEARIPLRGTVLKMVVRKTAGAPSASIDGKRVPMQDGKVQIPLPRKETTVEFEIPVAGASEVKKSE